MANNTKKVPYDAPTIDFFTQAAGAAPGAAADGVPLGDLFKRLGGWVGNHKGAALGTGLNAAMNVAGLLDNDKILGQGIGAALGGFAPKILGAMMKTPVAASPLAIANLAMIGGGLGSLFDNLRAKQEEEQAMAKQYGGRY